MDLSKVIADLRRELERLDAAIVSIERLEEEVGTRSRPPKSPADAKESTAAGRPGRKRAGNGGVQDQ